MKFISVILWCGVIIGSVIGGMDFYSAINNAESAPQQAAGAAMALCWAIIPYCVARAWDEIRK